MKKHDLLQDALGMIRDDLISDAKEPQTVRRRRIRRTRLLVAACLAVSILTATVILSLYRREVPQELSEESLPSVQFPAAENLWEQENFKILSLLYREEELSTVRASGGAGLMLLSEKKTGIRSDVITVEKTESVKFEKLLADRYAVYYSETKFPVFYDLKEQKEVDLQERIIGDTALDMQAFLDRAEQLAEEMYPGMLKTENNRTVFRQYLVDLAYGTDLSWYENSEPDTGYMSQLEDFEFGYYGDHEAFERSCSRVYYETKRVLPDAERGKPFRIELLALDGQNGICVVRVLDIVGNGLAYLFYDIKTDRCLELPEDEQNHLHGTMIIDGYTFRFSADGSLATVVFPDLNIGESNLPMGVIEQERNEDSVRYISNYRGETVGVFDFERQIAYRLDTDTLKAASEARISENGSFIYFKKMEQAKMGESFSCTGGVWYSRLQVQPDENAEWVFCKIDEETGIADVHLTLEGSFVRFLADETAVLMEKDGAYVVYSMEDGKEITESVRNGAFEILAHEQLAVYEENGILYRKDLLGTGEAVQVAQADLYLVSNDNAFAFAYRTGDSFVTCINVASSESIRLEIDRLLCKQLFSAENAAFCMTYSEEENTLLFSFYIKED